VHERVASRYLARDHDIVISFPAMAIERSEVAERRFPVSFPQELYEWLRERAFKDRVPMAEIIRLAVREHRERVDPQLPLPIGRSQAR